MIKKTNSKIHTWFLGLSIMMSCYNGSVIDTATEISIGPDVNFYGTLEDHGQISQVESILIGGRYESIPVYPQNIFTQHQDKNKINTEDIDPKQNKTFINLQDIKSIKLQHPNNPTTSSIRINQKIYIQIIVESLHGTKKHYLVESSRKITCKEIDENADIQVKSTLQDRDINFIHAKELIIKGYKSKIFFGAAKIDTSDDQFKKASKDQGRSAFNKERDDFKANSAELLIAIEENVKNMSLANPTTFESMRSTVLILLKSLRDQLQKFLDMIK